MPNSFSIRPFSAEDIPAAARLEREAFGENAWSERALTDELARSDAALFAALAEAASGGTEFIGYASMRAVLDEGYVGNVAVRAERRRRGVGRALTEALIRHARSREVRFLSLEVRVSNAPAIALYEGMGFRSMGIRRGFYAFPKEDALVMTFDF